ncbi:MAG: hypothetical protein LBE22_10375 [Azoarcus sp.]|jgi:hypothetical protein|nr:hypothetical protein [Azoarcus sp.]
MATVGGYFTDISDIKDQDGYKRVRPFVNLMAGLSGFVATAYWTQATNGDKHETDMQVSMPEPMFRRLYQGVPPTKGRTQRITDTCAILADRWEIDVQALLRLERDAQVHKRFKSGVNHIEGMVQTLESGFWYGNTEGAPEQFKGLTPRFNNLGTDPWGSQIIDCGGTGNENTSIWFVTQGENQAGCFYPQETMKGIRHTTEGTVDKPITIVDEGRNEYPGVKDFIEMNVGMYVADPRYVVRLANIDISALRAGTVDIYKFLINGYYRHFATKRRIHKGRGSIPGISEDDMAEMLALIGRTYIYCNTDVMEAIDLQQINKGAFDNFRRITTVSDVEGQMIETFRKHEIVVSDALLNTEARVV